MKTLPTIDSRSDELLTTVAFKKYNPNTSQGDISSKTYNQSNRSWRVVVPWWKTNNKPVWKIKLPENVHSDRSLHGLRSALLIVVTNTNAVDFDFCNLGFYGVANRLLMPLHTVTIEISKEWTSSQAAFTHPYAWLNLAAKKSAYSEIALLGKRIMFFSLTLGSNKIAVKHNKHTAKKHNSKKRTNFILSLPNHDEKIQY